MNNTIPVTKSTSTGGWFNHKESECPKNFFMEEDKWVIFAQKVFLGGSAPEQWKWKNPDQKVQVTQMKHLCSLLDQNDDENRIHIIAWALSEMVESP
jgi:hypothetical protein